MRFIGGVIILVQTLHNEDWRRFMRATRGRAWPVRVALELSGAALQALARVGIDDSWRR